MKFWSDSMVHEEVIDTRYAAGAAGLDGFAPNLNPPFMWDDVPQGTKSFALICNDPDAPKDKTNLDAIGEIIATAARKNFYHWAVINLPASLRSIAEGEFSNAFVVRGKSGPQAAHGSLQGLNDYTSWSANDEEMKGKYFGYDGPYPPAEDSIPHRYIFTLYALGVEKLDLPQEFAAQNAQEQIDLLENQGLVLASSSITGYYTTNPRLLKFGKSFS